MVKVETLHFGVLWPKRFDVRHSCFFRGGRVCQRADVDSVVDWNTAIFSNGQQ